MTYKLLASKSYHFISVPKMHQIYKFGKISTSNFCDVVLTNFQ